MSSNLLEIINENITGDVVSKLAEFLGESPKSTSSALSSAIPSILAGLVNKGTDIARRKHYSFPIKPRIS